MSWESIDRHAVSVVEHASKKCENKVGRNGCANTRPAWTSTACTEGGRVVDGTHAPANSDRSLPPRFARKIQLAPSGCWLWTGHVDSGGYGKIGGLRAHRVAYVILVGPIPEGMQLDHLCHTADISCERGPDCPHRRCVNPAHLEPVTGGENTRRGRSPSAKHAAKTHCPNGHPYDEVDSRGARVCSQCRRLSDRGRSHDERRKGRAKLTPGDPRHGTKSAYVNNGCRCAPCTEANTAYYRDLRARRRANTGGA